MTRTTRSSLSKITSSLALATILSLSAFGAQAAASAGSPPAPAPEEQAANPALAQFKDVLQRYGNFSQHPRYGEVWSPAPGTVPAGWSPYPACRWTYDRHQATWSYQDPTEWGSIVHHHGRWTFDQQAGWLWIADANYGPGWVQWKSEGASVSWAALGPDLDGGQPAGGWQSQDSQSFNSGCRPAAPPSAPVAYRPAAPAPSYAPTSAPIAYGPSRPVYVPPIYVPYPRPHYHGPHQHYHHGHHHHGPHTHGHHHPHGPIIIVTGPKPSSGGMGPGNGGNGPGTGGGAGPGGNQGPGGNGNPGGPGPGKPGSGGGAGTGGGPIIVGPGGGKPVMCIRAPCNITVGGAGQGPNKPGMLAGMQRPQVRPPFIRPHVSARPPIFRPQLQRPFQVARLQVSRPGGFQMGGFRPRPMMQARPMMARPSFQARPMMSRPSFGGRGFGGGGHRFAGGFRR